MAIQVTYICDSCGRTVTPENGVIGDHEFTIENRNTSGKKICIQISLGCVRVKEEHPVICSECFEIVINNWMQTGKNFVYYDDNSQQN